MSSFNFAHFRAPASPAPGRGQASASQNVMSSVPPAAEPSPAEHLDAASRHTAQPAQMAAFDKNHLFAAAHSTHEGIPGGTRECGYASQGCKRRRSEPDLVCAAASYPTGNDVSLGGCDDTANESMTRPDVDRLPVRRSAPRHIPSGSLAISAHCVLHLQACASRSMTALQPAAGDTNADFARRAHAHAQPREQQQQSRGSKSTISQQRALFSPPAQPGPAPPSCQAKRNGVRPRRLLPTRVITPGSEAQQQPATALCDCSIWQPAPRKRLKRTGTPGACLVQVVLQLLCYLLALCHVVCIERAQSNLRAQCTLHMQQQAMSNVMYFAGWASSLAAHGMPEQSGPGRLRQEDTAMRTPLQPKDSNVSGACSLILSELTTKRRAQQGKAQSTAGLLEGRAQRRIDMFFAKS